MWAPSHPKLGSHLIQFFQTSQWPTTVSWPQGRGGVLETPAAGGCDTLVGERRPSAMKQEGEGKPFIHKTANFKNAIWNVCWEHTFERSSFFFLFPLVQWIIKDLLCFWEPSAFSLTSRLYEAFFRSIFGIFWVINLL